MIPLVRGQGSNASSDLSLVHAPAGSSGDFQSWLFLGEAEGIGWHRDVMNLLCQTHFQMKRDLVQIPDSPVTCRRCLVLLLGWITAENLSPVTTYKVVSRVSPGPPGVTGVEGLVLLIREPK